VLDDIIASYSNTVYYSGSEFPTCYEFKRDRHTEFLRTPNLTILRATVPIGRG
jgi:hypothetical protein